MTNHVMQVGTAEVNISPDLFHEYARQYLECRRAFVASSKYSPVPYFLLCRAIELELKARHLESKSRDEVKRQYGHNIKRAYDQLPDPSKTLNAEEYEVLVKASKLYDIPNKSFEYVSVGHALTQLKHFPALGILDTIASKLIPQ